jgi:hypoxanthine phosphoribosyltransferase
LIPAVLLGRLLNIRNIVTIQIMSYTDRISSEKDAVITSGLDITGRQNLLFVDDIYHTGNTYKKIQKEFPGHHYCALFSKKEKPENVIYGQYVDHDKWLNFPWERLDL